MVAIYNRTPVFVVGSSWLSSQYFQATEECLWVHGDGLSLCRMRPISEMLLHYPFSSTGLPAMQVRSVVGLGMDIAPILQSKKEGHMVGGEWDKKVGSFCDVKLVLGLHVFSLFHMNVPRFWEGIEGCVQNWEPCCLCHSIRPQHHMHGQLPPECLQSSIQTLFFSIGGFTSAVHGFVRLREGRKRLHLYLVLCMFGCFCPLPVSSARVSPISHALLTPLFTRSLEVRS